MKKMRNAFRAALKDDDLQMAFDELWPTWSSEMAAMIYSDIIQVMDLILLTSIVDNARAHSCCKRTSPLYNYERTCGVIIPSGAR